MAPGTVKPVCSKFAIEFAVAQALSFAASIIVVLINLVLSASLTAVTR